MSAAEAIGPLDRSAARQRLAAAILALAEAKRTEAALTRAKDDAETIVSGAEAAVEGRSRQLQVGGSFLAAMIVKAAKSSPGTIPGDDAGAVVEARAFADLETARAALAEIAAQLAGAQVVTIQASHAPDLSAQAVLVEAAGS